MKHYIRNLASVAAIALGLLFHSQAFASTLQCPNINSISVAQGGDQYTVPANGLVTGVNGGKNISSLLYQGCTIADTIAPASTSLYGNPQVHTVVGTTTLAQINSGTNTIIAGVAGRKIYVTSFDLVATGTPATCTGVYLEDNNGTPVIAATVLVAALSTTVHALPLVANTNAGFGSSGLTAGKDLQLNVDGSACITMTSMAYSVSYIIQ